MWAIMQGTIQCKAALIESALPPRDRENLGGWTVRRIWRGGRQTYRYHLRFIGKVGTVYDLAEFEQAYAPPFSSAKDPVNMVGFIAVNVLEGMSDTISWMKQKRHE